MTRPLEGIRLLEWAALLNGPVAGCMFADLGAEVIKIEDPVRGDPSRGFIQMWDRQMFLPGGINITYESANRNKKSIALNLKTDRGREILRRLVERSDGFYTNYPREMAARLGADYASLAAQNPRIVYVAGSGYGPDGPDAGKRAYDVAIQARSGLMYAAGDRDSPEPYPIVGAVVDYLGATMVAYAMLVGLMARERFGVGQQIETSMLGAAVHLQALNVNTLLWRGRRMPRHSRTRVANPFHNHYQCSDGRWLLICEPQYDRFWDNICGVFERPDLGSDPRFATPEARREHCAELTTEVAVTVARRARDEWRAILEKGAAFAFDVVQDLDELVEDPQVIVNKYVTSIDHPVLGHLKLAGTPIHMSAMDTVPLTRAPELGEHTEEVLIEIGGYTWDEITELRQEGAI